MDIEGTFFNIIKAINDKLPVNTIFNGDMLKTVPPTSGTRKGCQFSQVSFDINTGTSSQQLGKKKR